MVKLLLIFLVAQFATQGTHYLALTKKMSGVRASSLVTLIFIGLTFFLPYEHLDILHAVCLGGSFVGMSDPQRLSVKQLGIASLVFAFFFHFCIHFFKGIGGALGFSAFISCVFIYFISHQYRKFRPS